MVELEYSVLPGGVTPEKKRPPSASTEDKTRKRSESLDSVELDVIFENREKKLRLLEQIEEKASSVLEFREKMEERVRVIEAREKEIGLLEESTSGNEIEIDFRHVIEASLLRFVLEKQIEEVVTQLKTQEDKLGLIHHTVTKKLGDMMIEFEGKKEETRRLFESVHKKLCKLDNAEKEFDLKQRVETERQNEESKQLDAKKSKLRLLEEAIKEKSAELRRKEETFELKQKEEAEKLRVEADLKRKELEIKERTLVEKMELEEGSKQQLVQAETRKRSNLELEPPLLSENDTDEDASLTRLAKKHKFQEADDDAIDTKFNDFTKSMNSFAVDQVWALHDTRDDMPRIYAQIREVFSYQSSLQVTLLEHVKTTKDEKSSIPNACGRFEYGDTEIKSHSMFVHEMHHNKCGKDVIVNPRKGETWALFRDWKPSWNSNPDMYEPPCRFDFVEVISEFVDNAGIAVAYMGRVEGFVSVFSRAEQHGLIELVIKPEEMQRFSHRVESVKLTGEEKEGVSDGSFELNPAATRSYDHLIEDQDGSTKDLAILID